MKQSSLLLIVAVLFLSSAQAQTPNQNISYSYQFYQKLNKPTYDVNSRFHSSIKGFYADDPLLETRFDSLMNIGVDSLADRSWLRRKLTDEHLFGKKGEDYSIYADFLPDFQIGRDISDAKNTWLNTRGFQIGGTIGNKFSFYTNGFENQGVFANYITEFIDSNQVVPSQMTGKLRERTKDWAYVSALLSYTFSKHFNAALGYDKNFIGDGYRSMLLSDVAANYSFLRLRVSFADLQYQTIFAYMLDPGAPKLTGSLGDRGKWAAMHYIDWNATDRFSVGLFQAVTWADAQPEGRRGFDFNYIHPFIFLRPIESSNSTSPDKMRLGLNLKYEVLDKTAVYGQFMFDEFVGKEFFAGNGFWANKWAMQLGVRGSDLFDVNNLNYLAEFNTARPYTYSHRDRISNYAARNQPLAHPFGANFRELLGILNYSRGRFDFQGQLVYALYGKDPEGTNYGKDIFKSYNTREADYGNYIGQGIKTNLYFAEGRVAYLVNPKYNLRLELGGILRREASIENTNSLLFTFGLRSTFRNLYQDF